MKQCPKCKKWTLDFDQYFGRFRCYDLACQWMPASAVERKMKSLEAHVPIVILKEKEMPEIGMTLKAIYDPQNDVLEFDFGSCEPIFEVPESDGLLVWKIGHQTQQVVGFSILHAKEFNISEIQVNINARKNDIETALKRGIPAAVSCGRVTKAFIDSISIMVKAQKPKPVSEYHQLENVVHKVLKGFEEKRKAIPSAYAAV
ncbi:MAG: hypothetical protein NTX50_12535 [Candidatus Sumerlaeota bacterium]|nr:hypothetical protein [Candidatus Sumerlaeota bacterium]